MYKLLKIRGRVRVDPQLLKEKLEDAVRDAIIREYSLKLTKHGLLLVPNKIEEIGEGVVIPGDGAVYYNTVFEMLAYQPELHEVVEGRVVQITEFGAFVRIGPLDGLVHVSQVTDGYMSYSKSGSLQSRDGKKSLKLGDVVRARVIAISLKSLASAKIGLTMRQPGLGKLEWLEAEKKKKEAEKKAKAKEKKKEEKKGKKK